LLKVGRAEAVPSCEDVEEVIDIDASGRCDELSELEMLTPKMSAVRS
jgi:hypothetical protein